MAAARALALLCALAASAHALPSAHPALKAPAARSANLNLRGGGFLDNPLLTERQTVQTLVGLMGSTAVFGLAAPEKMLEAYKIRNPSKGDFSSVTWCMNTFASLVLLFGLIGLAGMSLFQAYGIMSAYNSVFIAFQMFSLHGDCAKFKMPRNPFYFWLSLNIVAAALSFTDSEHMPLLIKLLSVVFVANGAFITFAFDTFTKAYGATGVDFSSPLTRLLWRNNGLTNIALGAFIWLTLGGASISEALLPYTALTVLSHANSVAMQDWRKLGQPNGLPQVAWLVMMLVISHCLYHNK